MKTQPFRAWGPDVRLHLVVLIVLALAGAALYIPFLGNPFVFDDGNLFFSERLTTAAVEPWVLITRSLPYFTLGWTQTQLGTMEAHRLISLALHVLVGWQLYRLLRQMLLIDYQQATPDVLMLRQASVVAALIALIFVVHPVAVYGAGYLIQRTTVMAALFAIVCVRYLLDALNNRSPVGAIGAALMSSLSILCKEHSVTVPFAAALLVAFLCRVDRQALRILAVFIVANLPAVALVFSLGLGFVGQPYEPGLSNLEGEIHGLPEFSDRWERWLFSVSNQAQLYYQYWLQWLAPSAGRMSADLRVDFLQPWTWVVAGKHIALFLVVPVASGIFALVTGRGRLLAGAFMFTGALFAVEFSLIRFQEPYVLYRSYIWAIGYAAAVAVLIRDLPLKWLIPGFLFVFVVLFSQAQNRLESFSSRSALWEDAAAKLTKPEIAGASRIFFNRGNERFQRGDFEGSLADIGTAIALNPASSAYRIARAQTLTRIGRPADAIADLDAAERIPGHEAPRLWFERFRALYALHSTEAEAALQKAALLGSFQARYFIEKRRSRNGETEVAFEGIR
ncbi:MAG: hypothetical protein QE495_17790 [Acidovorax sp.]|jgi:tetratricopeptide (TPR) repeat protein|nr:hypothetical protein [Acidovorax sp.]